MDFLTSGGNVSCRVEGGIIDARMFLLPLADSHQQLTIIEVSWPSSDGAHAVILRMPAPASLEEAPIGLLDALRASFPSTAPTRHAWDDESGDESGNGGGREENAPRVPTGVLPRDSYAPPGARANAVPCEVAAVPAELTAGLTNAGTGSTSSADSGSGSGWDFFQATAAAGGVVAARATALFCVRHALPPAGLWLPLRSSASFSQSPGGGMRWTVMSAGGAAAEEGGWANAGATPAETLASLRRRLATGSFRDLLPPTRVWSDVATAYALDASLALRVRKGAAAGVLPLKDVFIPLAASPGAAAAAAAGGGGGVETPKLGSTPKYYSTGFL